MRDNSENNRVLVSSDNSRKEDISPWRQSVIALSLLDFPLHPFRRGMESSCEIYEPPAQPDLSIEDAPSNSFFYNQQSSEIPAEKSTFRQAVIIAFDRIGIFEDGLPTIRNVTPEYFKDLLDILRESYIVEFYFSVDASELPFLKEQLTKFGEGYYAFEAPRVESKFGEKLERIRNRYPELAAKTPVIDSPEQGKGRWLGHFGMDEPILQVTYGENNDIESLVSPLREKLASVLSRSELSALALEANKTLFSLV